jgi:hypothetical protein
MRLFTIAFFALLVNAILVSAAPGQDMSGLKNQIKKMAAGAKDAVLKQTPKRYEQETVRLCQCSYNPP